jgi:hypothetical protein
MIQSDTFTSLLARLRALDPKRAADYRYATTPQEQQRCLADLRDDIADAERAQQRAQAREAGR